MAIRVCAMRGVLLGCVGLHVHSSPHLRNVHQVVFTTGSMEGAHGGSAATEVSSKCKRNPPTSFNPPPSKDVGEGGAMGGRDYATSRSSPPALHLNVELVPVNKYRARALANMQGLKAGYVHLVAATSNATPAGGHTESVFEQVSSALASTQHMVSKLVDPANEEGAQVFFISKEIYQKLDPIFLRDMHSSIFASVDEAATALGLAGWAHAVGNQTFFRACALCTNR